ncbi:MAG: AraC family transcriptional regulator [Steroidobacteraceae bacterium]|jgi:AraC-like DNA-binding protein|nr:AraC family transcriptional regulator [Steroidobacteraceae bacterium]
MTTGNAMATREWQPNIETTREHVETWQLREGISLVLSALDLEEPLEFSYAEPHDVFGIGFHLKGGSRFALEGSVFDTQPLDVWAGTAPRCSTSRFRLSVSGFRTVALRFTPQALQHLLDGRTPASGCIVDLARRAQHDAAVARLPSLDMAGARMVASMFSTPYTGTARTLFLESCALALLATQVDSATHERRTDQGRYRLSHRKKLEAAREHLDARLLDPPTIATLARSVGTNEFFLKREFKRAFGVTIFGYVRARCMERAIAELLAGCPVEQAARAAGYGCTRSFAIAFRRHTGVLPSTVRRRFRSDPPAQYAHDSRSTHTLALPGLAALPDRCESGMDIDAYRRASLGRGLAAGPAPSTGRRASQRESKKVTCGAGARSD